MNARTMPRVCVTITGNGLAPGLPRMPISRAAVMGSPLSATSKAGSSALHADCGSVKIYSRATRGRVMARLCDVDHAFMLPATSRSTNLNRSTSHESWMSKATLVRYVRRTSVVVTLLITIMPAAQASGRVESALEVSFVTGATTVSVRSETLFPHCNRPSPISPSSRYIWRADRELMRLTASTIRDPK